MIKFQYIIHKPTRQVVPYDVWRMFVNERTKNIEFIDYSEPYEPYSEAIYPKTYVYKDALDMLIRDEFEIIYDDILTYYEIGDILCKTRLKEENERLFYKLKDKSDKMLSLMYMYDIKL